MSSIFRSREPSGQTDIDRDYRLIGWYGMGLASLGAALLLVAVVSTIAY